MSKKVFLITLLLSPFIYSFSQTNSDLNINVLAVKNPSWYKKNGGKVEQVASYDSITVEYVRKIGKKKVPPCQVIL